MKYYLTQLGKSLLEVTVQGMRKELQSKRDLERMRTDQRRTRGEERDRAKRAAARKAAREKADADSPQGSLF
tara:strand:- start:626 stop:841 length:216 start_codon:yes stop_codon:yes gene_type:complete